MTNHIKYFKYKNKYLKLKNQIGSAPTTLSDLPTPLLFDHLNLETQKTLAKTNTQYAYSTYNSTFAPDINIPCYLECNNNDNCNKYNVHSRIKSILNKYNERYEGRRIPSDGVNIIPLLNDVIFDTIEANNIDDCEFLISIGASIDTIDDNKFEWTQFETVFIPPTVITIGNSSFTRSSLKILNIPPSVKYIGNSAFYSNVIKTLHLPESVISIGERAFEYNQIETLNIPSTLKSIGINAFKYNKLTKLIIPDNVSFIGKGAFQFNLIETVTIPLRFQPKINDIFDNYHFQKINFIYI